MEKMTNGDKRAFIEKRVKSILNEYADLGRTIDAMSPDERDRYVHRRVEVDLASGHGLGKSIGEHFRDRSTTAMYAIGEEIVNYIFIIFMFYILVTHHIFNLYVSIGIAVTIGVVKFLIYSKVIRMNTEFARIIELIAKYMDRLEKTASLDFLVDKIQLEIELYDAEGNRR